MENLCVDFNFVLLFSLVTLSYLYLFFFVVFQHMVTVDKAAEQIIIRGLIRIVAVEEWLPNILAHFTDRCLINVGRCVESQQVR